MACTTMRFGRLMAILALVIAGSAACGDGGDGDDGGGGGTSPVAASTAESEVTATAASASSEPADDRLPEPPAGLATLGGQVTLDGAPVVGEDVTLYLPSDGDDEADTAAEATTDADGWYVLEGITPGPYVLGAGVLVEGLETAAPGGFGLDVDSPCAAAGFTVLNALMEDSATGEELGWVASATTDEGELQLSSGDRLRLDVAFVCGGGTQARP